MTARRHGGRAAVVAVTALVVLAGFGGTAVATPTLTITQPVAGSWTNNATPPVDGTTDDILDPITLRIYSGGNTEGLLVQTSTISAPLSESWETTAESLAEGEYTAVAEQTNILETGTSGEVSFKVDTTQPNVSMSPVPSPGHDATPTLHGAGGTEAGDHGSVSVTIYKGASVGGPEAASQSVPVSSAEWSYTPPHLEDGTYTAQAVQTDAADNTGTSAAVTFTVDTTAPGVSVDALASPTKDATPTITGGGGTEPGDAGTVTVKIYSAGKTLVSSEVATVSSGTWSLVTGHLEDGSYTAVAEQSDEAGNTGISSPSPFVLDTTPPSVTLTALPALIKSATPTFAGNAGTASGDNGSVTLKIFTGAAPSGTPVQTLVAKAGSGWSVGASGALADGTYTAIAEQADQASNVGVSSPTTFTVDTIAPNVTLNPLPSLTNEPTPTFTGAAGTSEHDNASVALKIYKGTSASGTPVQTLLTGASGATWTATPATALAEGVYTAIALQSDEAGNTGVSSTTTFTVETALPKVTLKSLPALGKDTTPTFSGNAGTGPHDLPTVTLKIYAGTSAGGSFPVQILTSEASGGTWSMTPLAALADGPYTAIAQQSNEASGTGQSGPSTFTVDTTPPSVTLNSLPVLVNTATPTFSGGAGTESHDNPVVTIKVYEGASATGSPVQTLLAKPTGGSWAAAPPKSLGEGQYTAIAEQSDEAGNNGVANPTTFTVDTALPKVTLKPVAPISKNTLPTFGGNAGVAAHDLATVTVKIYPGTAPAGAALQTLLAKASAGAWTVGASGALADGTYTAIAEQSNEAGQTGQSIPSTFIVDTKAPDVTINAVAPLSNNATPTLSGSAGSAAEHSLPTVKVKVYAGSSAAGSPVQTLEPKAGGHLWSATAAKLADGTYTAIAEQSDEAGNTASSNTTTFTVDTAAPTVTLSHLPPLTNNATPTFSGSAGTAPHDKPVVTVRIYEGTSAAGTPVQTHFAEASGGAWSTTPITALADGTYTAIAEQSDEAGNSGKSPTTTFIVDTVAPTVTLHPLLPAVTSNPTPTFNGNAGTALHDLSIVTLKIYLGTAVSGKAVQTVEVTSSAGAWSVKSKTLADGTYTAIAEQRDEAGNTGRSVSSTFTVKTKGPNVTLLPVRSPTNSPTPAFSGTAGTPAEHDNPDVTLNIYAGTAASGTPVQTVATEAVGGTWTVTATKALADGTYTAIAEQSDTTGNVGKSVASPFVVDATPPHLTLTSPADGSVTTSSSQFISGTAGTEAGDSEQVTVQLFSGSSASGAPLENHAVATSGASRSWSTTFAGLAPGTYTVRGVQLDEAGSLGASPSSTFTVSAPPASAPAPAAAAKPPPVASFTWIPSSPHVGETVTLISNSTASVEAITGLAWNAAGNGVFTPGGPVTTTSFAKAGAYPVQLRVTTAAGLSSVASRTIPITSVPLVLMQPFPVVRIVGYDTARGVTLRLLSVVTPVNARATVSCRGSGCPTRAESHLARADSSTRRGGSVLINFRRFARPLPAGVTLQIRVAKPGQIGKYTRFTVRRGKLPMRVDSCLDPTGVKPIACPSR